MKLISQPKISIPKDPSPGYIKIKLSKIKDKERIVKVAREKQFFYIREPL